MSTKAEELIYQLVNAIDGGLVVLDAAAIITDIYVSRRPSQAFQHLRGKNFFTLSQAILPRETYNLLRHHIGAKEGGEVPAFSCGAKRDRPEFYKIMVIPHGAGKVVIWQNVTETTALLEEFNRLFADKEQITQELAEALSNLEFYLMDLEQTHKKLRLLYQITAVVQRTTDLSEVFNTILDGMVRDLGYEYIAILLLDRNTDRLHIKAYRGTYINPAITIKLGEHSCSEQN